ncbi:MAG: 6-phosphogluconolactonase [Candidatus Gracilibacteria bacterium]|nr:6-phosphogluconolactonase [Candidatus Gracilibacteria bacterium]
MHLQTFSNKQAFIQASTDLVLQHKVIALSGGRTPLPIYQELAKHDLSKMQFYQVDERYVSLEDPASNAGMILENLKPHHFTHFDTTLGIEEALADYETKLQGVQFDLCVLGIGRDGHFASLFPYSEALQETSSPVAHTESSDGTDRLTLTLEPILSSKKILVLLQGKDKLEVLHELQHPSKEAITFPAKELLKHENMVVYYCES